MPIRYTVSKFSPPSRISEEQFLFYKQNLLANRNFKLDPNEETFSKHFSFSIKTLKISGPVFLICLIISILPPSITDFFNEKGILFPFLLISSFLFCCAMITNLFLEGPSYDEYLIQKKRYFSKLSNSIYHSLTYDDFLFDFYGIKKDYY